MRFTDHLTRLGLVSDADEKGGSGPPSATLSPEERTNAKITGTLDDPEGESPPAKTESTAKPAAQKNGQAEPDEPDPQPDRKEEEEEPTETPDPDPEPAASHETPDPSEPPEEGAGGEGDSRDEFYYDPEVHVDGKPAHTNKFRTRENAEYAAVQKAALMKETMEKMKEEGVDRGAIPLPGAMAGSEASLDSLTNLETVVGMDDETLRGFLNESDAFRQRLEAKFERKQKEMQTRQANDRFEQLQVETFDNLQKLMPVEEVKANLDKFSEKDSGSEFTRSRIDQKVKEALKADRDELETWIDQVDSGEIDMTFKQFDAEKARRVEAMQRKEREIRGEFEPVLDQLAELYELSQDVQKHRELTPEQKREKLWGAFSEFQTDRAGDLPMLDDTPAARAELVSFKNWAVQNAADYNDLLHPQDFNEAVRGWNDFKAKVRAGRQKKDLNRDGAPASPARSKTDDIPKPGDQDRIRGDRGKNPGDVRRRSMDKLVELTNATIGT